MTIKEKIKKLIEDSISNGHNTVNFWKAASRSNPSDNATYELRLSEIRLNKSKSYLENLPTWWSEYFDDVDYLTTLEKQKYSSMMKKKYYDEHGERLLYDLNIFPHDDILKKLNEIKYYKLDYFDIYDSQMKTTKKKKGSDYVKVQARKFNKNNSVLVKSLTNIINSIPSNHPSVDGMLQLLADLSLENRVDSSDLLDVNAEESYLMKEPHKIDFCYSIDSLSEARKNFKLKKDELLSIIQSHRKKNAKEIRNKIIDILE